MKLQTHKAGSSGEPPAETENSLLAVYRALARTERRHGRVDTVEGTTIDYPVMQTPDDFNFYLRRNFDKEYSNLGTPYIQENCDLKTSDNLILYGHHMLDGGMFSDLDLYKKKSFWEKHKTIRFDTLDEIAEYEILAVIVTTAYRRTVFGITSTQGLSRAVREVCFRLQKVVAV